MNIIIDYVESEQAFGVVDMDWNKLPDGSTVGDEIRELYTLIKVTLPKLELDAGEALMVWCDGCGIGEQLMSNPRTKTKEVTGLELDTLDTLDVEIEEMITDILQRIVSIRRYLWT